MKRALGSQERVDLVRLNEMPPAGSGFKLFGWAVSALILGSIAPLEECYRADLAPDAEICSREHGWMIETLLEAGVDVILIETQNCLHERFWRI